MSAPVCDATRLDNEHFLHQCIDSQGMPSTVVHFILYTYFLSGIPFVHDVLTYYMMGIFHCFSFFLNVLKWPFLSSKSLAPGI